MALAGGRPTRRRRPRSQRGRADDRAARRRDSRRSAVPARRRRIAAYVYFVETARPRRLSARRADRRVGDHPGAPARSDARDRADLGDAGRRRIVRLRRASGSGIDEAAELRVPSEFDFATQSLLYLPRRMPPPKSPEFADAVAREVTRDPAAHPRARVRALHQLRDDARGLRDGDGDGCRTRCWSRARRRAARCSSSSARRRTRCCLPPRRSGRAWTSSASN